MDRHRAGALRLWSSAGGYTRSNHRKIKSVYGHGDSGIHSFGIPPYRGMRIIWKVGIAPAFDHQIVHRTRAHSLRNTCNTVDNRRIKSLTFYDSEPKHL